MIEGWLQIRVHGEMWNARAYDRDRSPFLQGLPSMPEARAYGEDTARAVDGAFRALVDAGFARAIKILERNRALLDRTAE